MKTFLKNNIIYFILLLCLCAYEALQLPQSPFFNRYENDSSVYQYIGKMMLEGQLPYKDIFDHKGPLAYIWHMFSYALHPMYGLYYVETIWLFLSTLLAFHLAKKYLSPLLAFGVVSVVFSAIPSLDTIGNTESIALLPLMGLLYIFCNSIQNQKISFTKAGLTGFLAAVLLLIKPIYLCAPAIYILSLLLFFYHNKQYASLKKLIIFGGICGLIPILTTILYFYRHNALQDLWECFIVFNTKYAQYFSKIHNAHPLQKTIITFSKEVIVIIGLITTTVILLKLKQFTPLQKYTVLTIICAFIASLIVIIIPRNPFSHYTLILLPLVLMLAIVTIKLCPNKTNALAILEFIFIINLYITYNFLHHNATSAVDIERREIANIIQNILYPDETFIALDNHTPLYLYANRNSATKYPYAYAANRIMPEKTTPELNQPATALVIYKPHQNTYNIIYQRYIPIYENNRYIVAVHPLVFQR